MLLLIWKLTLEADYGSSSARFRKAYLKASSMPPCHSESPTQWQGEENKPEQRKTLDLVYFNIHYFKIYVCFDNMVKNLLKLKLV